MKRCIYVNPFVRYIERVRFCLGAVCQGPGFIRKTVEGEPFSFQKVWRVSAGFYLPKAEPLCLPLRNKTLHFNIFCPRSRSGTFVLFGRIFFWT